MSKTYQTKLVEEKVIAYRNCDNCNGKIEDGDQLTVESGHYEWGNDSVDSYDIDDACSIACLKALVKKRAEEWKEYSTAYIEIGRLDSAQALELAASASSH